MTANLKTWISGGSGTTFFQVLEEKNCQHTTYSVFREVSFTNKGKMKMFSDEENWVCCQQSYPERIAKGISLVKKEVIKGVVLEEQEGRKNNP